MSLYRPSSGAGLCSYISRTFRQISEQSFTSLYCSSDRRVSLTNPVSDSLESCKSKVVSSESDWIPNYGKLSRKLVSMNVNQHLPLPCSLSFRSFMHYGNPKQADNGSMSRLTDFISPKQADNGSMSRLADFNSPKQADNGSMSRPMDFIRGIMEESGSFRSGGSQLSQYNVEQNADILRITMLRNNTFVNLTDSKGQKKPGVCVSTGCLPDRGKDSRYGAEAAAEHVGREARKAGVKAVVVKISGFTHFKRKRQAIMAFKEGYTYGRGDQTPIVYMEDKTRRAHNGCRKPKKRRI